jgi:hypothetical protein
MSKVAVPAEREQARKPRGGAKDNEAKRRRVRTWAPRAPELGEVLASAGHPLDPGLRREMETRFGHDFTQVRIHTDQDAAALTALLGADAVTVGQDVYFGDGTFQPWSADGRRLIAHELLHTMQVPHVFGALRAGRDAGAVSLPHEPLEQKAEDEARHGTGNADSRPADQDRDVRERAPTAAWLRYATVTAEQRRTEQLDPATLVDRLAAGILRSLRGDPGDWSKRVRLHLVRLGPELRSAVLDKLEVRLPSAPYQHVRHVVGELERDAAPLQVDSQPGPEPVAEPDAKGEQADRDVVDDSDTKQAQQLQEDAAARHQQIREEQEKEDHDRADQTAQAGQQREGDEKAAEQRKAGEQAADADAKKTDAQDKQQTGEKTEQHQKQQAADSKEQAERTSEKERAEQDPAQQEQNAKRPGGPAGTPPPRLGPVVGAQPMAAGPVAGAGGAPPVRADRVEAIAEEPGGPFARHRLTVKPGKTGEQRPDEVPPGEQPEGLDADPAGQVADVELPAPNVPQLPPQHPVPPDAYLPKQDMDVSAVPTADEIKLPASGAPPAPPAAPSFPAPPEPEQQAERPGEPDPLEKRLQQQDRRDGAEIALAPGQIGPDAATQEPDTAPEPADQAAPTPDATAAGAAADVSGAAAAGSMDGQAAAGPSQTAATATGPGEVADTDGPAGPAPGALAPDASLEAGGGPCAGGPEPSAGSGLNGTAATAGGGGGSAPAAADEQPEPPAPDVTQLEPTAALATVGQLPAARMLTSLGGVDASVSRSVGQDRAELAAHPPQLERPAGAPQTLHGAPEEAEPASYAPDEAPKAVPEGACKHAKPEDKTVMGAPTPVAHVQALKVTGDPNGKITDADAQNIQDAVDSVPTTDPVLDQASVGVPQTVELSCDTDPALTDEQQARLKEKSDAILATGREDAAKPLGENRIYPDVPHEILRAKVPAVPAAGQAGATGAVGPGGATADGVTTGGTAAPGGATADGADAVGDQAISAVAQQERGPEIQEAVGQGQSQMATGQQDKQQQEETAQKDHQEKVAAAIKAHTDEQTAERAGAKREARDQRKRWQAEQDMAVGAADKEAGKDHEDARAGIARAKTDTDGQISEQQRVDNKSIADTRRDAEEKARKERDKAKEPSGLLSRIGSAIASAFDRLVSLVKDAFDRARRFVQGVIDRFKNWVIGLIEKARKAIVDLINKLANALIVIGGKLLAAFPGLRDKFRKRIEKFRDDAIHAVNKVANRLKTAVTKLLDALSKALTDLLNRLEKALVAAVQFVKSAVVGVINFVKNAIALLGEFAALVRDVAVDPGGWISKLKAAVVDGIKYFLWDAVKTAVKKWFDDKVEEITGLGKMVIDVLRKGCFSIAMIAQKVWDALIDALPGMLIETAIEQLIALVIPAAGAIMAIVRGAIAAYHAVSKIIAAIGKFIAFLKAVRSGQAARPFAEAVAAGVVALLEFIASFLMSKLAGAAKGVAGALKGIADRIVKFLARGAKAVKKGMGAAVNLARRGAKAAAGAIKRGFHAVVRGGKRGAKWIAAKAKGAVKAIGRGTRSLGGRLAKTRLGKSLANAGHKLKAKYQQYKAKVAVWRDKHKKWREDRKKNKPTPEQRLEKAVEHIRPRVQSMLKRGVPSPMLRIVLRGMRTWYRLSELTIQGSPGFEIDAALNPRKIVLNGVELDSEPILAYIRRLEVDIREQAGERVGSQRLDVDVGPTGRKTVMIPPTMDIATANVLIGRAQVKKGKGMKSAQVLRWLGAAGSDVWRRLMRWTPSSWFLKKMRGEKTSIESGSYSESEKRILKSGQVRQAAAALAKWPNSRETYVGGDPSETTLLSTLAFVTEQERNPGNLVSSLLHTDLYAKASVVQDERKLVTLFSRAFRRQPMAVAGTGAAGNVLAKFIELPPGEIDRQILALRSEVVRSSRLVQNLPGSVRESFSSRSEKVQKFYQKRHPALQDLQKLEDANNLANREVQLLETWFHSIRGIDVETYGQREAVLNDFASRVEARLKTAFPWWNPPPGMRPE